LVIDIALSDGYVKRDVTEPFGHSAYNNAFPEIGYA